MIWTDVKVQPSGRLEESEVGVGGLHFVWIFVYLLQLILNLYAVLYQASIFLKGNFDGIHLMCRLNKVLCILAPEKVLNSCEITVVLEKIMIFVFKLFSLHLHIKSNIRYLAFFCGTLFSISTTPQGYSRPLTLFPSSLSIVTLEPTTANGGSMSSSSLWWERRY